MDFFPDYTVKLGITVPSNIVLHTEELHVAFIKKGSVRGGWVADESGHNTAGWGLTLTAMDMRPWETVEM